MTRTAQATWRTYVATVDGVELCKATATSPERFLPKITDYLPRGETTVVTIFVRLGINAHDDSRDKFVANRPLTPL